MDDRDIRRRLDSALGALIDKDAYLFENNLSERCIAVRLAMYLQGLFPDWSVDAEYNRHGGEAKKLGLPPECANKRDEHDKACVIPDIIVHTRGRDGPNLLVIEMKKSTNPDQGKCDRMRLHAFREELKYSFGALIVCETRNGRGPAAIIEEWLG